MLGKVTDLSLLSWNGSPDTIATLDHIGFKTDRS